jgi:hypothetical protein
MRKQMLKNSHFPKKQSVERRISKKKCRQLLGTKREMRR